MGSPCLLGVSLLGLVVGGIVIRADGAVARAGIGLAATAETIGARLEETGARSANSRIVVAGLDSFGIGADRTLARAGVRLAATTETVRARLEKAGAGSANSGVGSSLGVLRVGASVVSTSVALAATLEAVGADLEETSAGGALSFRELLGWCHRLGLIFRLRLPMPLRVISRLDGGNKIASLVLEVGAPVIVASIDGAMSTKAIGSADVVRAGTLAFSLRLLGRLGHSEASDGNESKDGRMHFGYFVF